jgi:molybdenum cofactor cytidylyltransferase
VVPAAGFGTRMPGCKLVTPFAGRPLVVHAVANALGACRRVIVVLGHNSREVAATLPRDPALVCVENPGFEMGMLTSIARGAKEVRSDRFFVAPADMPFLTPSLYSAVFAAAERTQTNPVNGEPVAAWIPEYLGTRGHPVLIRTSLVPELVNLVAQAVADGAPGTAPAMREFLAGRTTQRLPVSDEGSTIDIDTPEAVRRYEGRGGAG